MMRGARLLGGSKFSCAFGPIIIACTRGRGKNNFWELICGQPNKLPVCVSGSLSLWQGNGAYWTVGKSLPASFHTKSTPCPPTLLTYACIKFILRQITKFTP